LRCNNSVYVLLQADIKPKVDGCNGLRYDLTVDVIDSIFRTYPAGNVNNFASFSAQIFLCSLDCSQLRCVVITNHLLIIWVYVCYFSRNYFWNSNAPSQEALAENGFWHEI